MRRVSPVLLEGRHVRLEPLTVDHVPALVRAAGGGGQSFRFTSVPQTPEGMHAYVTNALAEQDRGTRLALATVDRSTGQVVGCTSFLDIQFWKWPAGARHQRGEHLPDVVEIGATWLSAAAQRTGINTEAKLLMLGHAFEVWRVHRVSLKTDSRNQQSREAILRLGTRFDGVRLRARLR